LANKKKRCVLKRAHLFFLFYASFSFNYLSILATAKTGEKTTPTPVITPVVAAVITSVSTT